MTPADDGRAAPPGAALLVLPPRDIAESIVLARRATFDPGQFTIRVLYDVGESEMLERWQARAVLVALAASKPDLRWARSQPDITSHENVEIAALRRIGSL